jgi:Mitochondrial protein Pet127
MIILFLRPLPGNNCADLCKISSPAFGRASPEISLRMRPLIRSTDYVCLLCLLREGRNRLFSTTRLRSNGSSEHLRPLYSLDDSTSPNSNNEPNTSQTVAIRKNCSDKPQGNQCLKPPRRLTALRYVPSDDAVSKRAFSSVHTEDIELSPAQLNELQAVNRLRNRLQSGIVQSKSNEQPAPGLSLEQALKLLSIDRKATDTKVAKENQLIPKLEEIYTGRELSEVIGDLTKLSQHRRPRDRIVKDAHIKKLLEDFGFLELKQDERAKDAQDSSPVVQEVLGQEGLAQSAPIKEASIQELPSREGRLQEETPPEPKPTIARLDESRLKIIEGCNLAVTAIKVETPTVPTLSYGLRRVLFNQGIHQLQDSRTGVFNFDPYLQRIMPVSEFNFDALGEYITSSEDHFLRNLARENWKRYIGSSSSMSGALTHFHHLLSQFRDISTKTLSQSFVSQSNSLTMIQKAPSAIFLRYKEGVYAVDADKEYDSANVLMSLGRSMEKLMTVPKEEFEKYRKGASLEELSEPKPESYHYCEQGDFLLRSQLDAYDPDLPGSGMFDLKTRAVVSIRMNISRHEEGVGYQIKSRFGNYESYEREYYDMIRSAFLKYSLQVRMGRMDGIFVAYHNIERIFGFQYMPLSEMDLHLHGQEDRTLGDTEFKLSIAFLNKVFDLATQKFPERSLRFHFEARPGTAANPAPYMYIFAEPLDEDEIQQIQDSRKAEIAEFERRIFNPGPDPVSSTTETEAPSTEPLLSPCPSDNAADVNFLDGLSKEQVVQASDPSPPSKEERPILALKLIIRNKQNGYEVPRPHDLKREDVWMVEYNMDELSAESARRLYKQCQGRRKSALTQQSPDDAPLSFYMQRLRNLSLQGAAWRKKQDEIDEKRGVRVVYESDHKSDAIRA